jgi:hypothetical protein
MTRRLIPTPTGTGRAQPVTANGRSYTLSSGGTLDVADGDAQVLCANGWCIDCGLSGTTANRPSATVTGLTAAAPAPLFAGARYIDTSLSVDAVYDGTNWRSCLSGAVV